MRLEDYRRLYNEFRPHSSLNYAPPAPMTKIMPLKNRQILTLTLDQKVGAWHDTQMDSAPEFCKLLGLPCGEYAIDGCVLGYQAHNYQPPNIEYPDSNKSVDWR